MGCSMFERDPRLPQGTSQATDPREYTCPQGVPHSAGRAPDYGRQNNSPKDVHILIPRASEYVSLWSRRDFADVIEPRTWRWGGNPGASGPSIFTGELITERQEGQIPRRRSDDKPGGRSDVGREQGMHTACSRQKRP